MTVEPMPASRPASNHADTTLGSGIESGIVLLIFAGIGYGIDRWLDTSPIFTLGLFALGAVGLFYRFKAAYTIRMDAYDAERRERAAGGSETGGGRP
jgi:F0F1-type ATP synthase assembly protein I